MQAGLEKRGFKVYPSPSSTLFGLPASLSQRIEARSQHATLPVRPGRSVGSLWMVLVFSGMGRASYLKKLVDAERQAAESFGANYLFTDLDPAAFILSRVIDLPVASAYASIMQHGIGGLPWAIMHHALNDTLRSYSLPPTCPEELLFGPHTLKIIPSIPELDDTPPDSPDACYVGQLLGEIGADQPTFQPEPGKHYGFVYVGTGSVSQDMLRAVLPRVFPADSSTQVFVGAQSITQPERLGNVFFQPYVPAAHLLPHCDWVLCHGGQNTIMQSLVNGVPLILFPGPIFERRYNAQKVQRAGAGLMGELPDFTPDWLRTTLTQIPTLARSAQSLASRIVEYGGAQAAVARICK
jgi:hypothetical protein